MNLNELAQRVDEAALQAKPIAQLSHESQFNLDEAYEIQRLAIQRRLDRGEKLIGLKMGFTSVAKMEQMGVHDMIWGRLTDEMIIENGGQLSLSKFIHPRAEPEVCFRVSKAIDSEIALEDLDQYVDGMAAAVEVIDSRFENFKFSLEDVVADNCSSSALVVGEWQAPSRDITSLDMNLNFDAEEVASGSSADILGDPWKSLQAATRLAAQYHQPIEAGHIIMAGAATNAVFLKPGIEVSANVERMGEVAFSVGE